MACLVVDKSAFQLERLYSVIMQELPHYAAPLFLRMREEMEVTTTFKHKKTTLVEEGFNINIIKDPIYVRDDHQKKYIPLSPELYNKIINDTLSAKL